MILHRTIISAVALLVSSYGFSQEIADSIGETDSIPVRWEDTIGQRLAAITEDVDRSSYYAGISIYDLTSDSLLFAYNQHKMMRPASTEKVLTAITALDLLGAAHEYTTSIYIDGTIDTDSLGVTALNGNLYVVGDFDPMIETAHLKQISQLIYNKGIRRINGNLIADVSMKDTLALGNGWCWDDEQPYLTPLSLSGHNYESTPERINRYSPTRYFLQQLAVCLNADSISVAGTGILPMHFSDNTQLIGTLVHRIDEVLPRMMKNSDNLYAESMFYQIGAIAGKNVSWKDCASRVSATIAKTGASADYAEIVDGSGLSLYDYVTPSVEVAMLRYAYNNEKIFGPLYHSLPIAGVDGTLTNRMRSTSAANNVHAKTGSVTGVSSLAGYLTTPNGHLVAFSIICNSLKKSAEGRSLQDRICITLTEK